METRIERLERRNGPLLRKVGDVIAAEPDRYEQGAWAVVRDCGTTACLAGHVVMLVDGFERFKFADNGQASWAYVGGLPSVVSSTARLALRLSSHEASRLFSWNWEPAGDPSTPLHERVRDALYALADGATVDEVTAS